MSDLKPILFNGEMVKALLEGRKTVTRRLLKPQPGDDAKMAYTYAAGRKKDWGKWRDLQTGQQWNPPCHADDILYVRETWAKMADVGPVSDAGYVYRADFTESELQELARKHFRWHPSLHMPKDAARIFLKVKNVRVEQLQDITVAEVIKEGCNDWLPYVSEFMYLWDSIIKPTDRPTYGWDANPWVWVIEFELISKEACT